jgi:hypothetical protein
MIFTAPGERRTNPPGYAGLLVFALLAVAWAFAWALPRAAPSVAAPWLARLSGYLAVFFMLWPYVHILRRRYRGHHGWPASFWRVRLSTWMRVHIVSAYLAFGFLLLHAWAKAGSPLTFWLTASVWAVMLSGAVGYYGQRALYRAIPIEPPEVGLERYAAMCDDQRRRVASEVKPHLAYDGKELWWEHMRRLVDRQLCLRIERPMTFWRWLVWGLRRDELPEVEYRNVRSFCAPLIEAKENADAACEAAKREAEAAAQVVKDLKAAGGADAGQAAAAEAAKRRSKEADDGANPIREAAKPYQNALEALDKVWNMAVERAALDYEYRLHQIGRLWLLFHGPASVALLALMFQHVWVSVRFGGW